MPLINLRELGKVGGNLATIGGAAVAGYGEDKADALKEALAASQAQRQARKDALDEAMGTATIRNLNSEVTHREQPTPRKVHTTITDPVSGIVHTIYDDGSVDSQPAGASQTPAVPGAPQVPSATPAAPLKIGVKPPDATKGQSEIPGTPEWKAAEQFKTDEAIRRAKTLAATKPHVQTPDQIKSSTVEQLATPAADNLLDYFTKHEGTGVQQVAGGIASHIPFVGHAAEGVIDANQQAADDAAETLATQYLEIMPKSRFQPTTIAEVRKQINYSPSDSPQTKAQKIARIRVLKAAIQARAKNPTDLHGILDDAPPP